MKHYSWHKFILCVLRYSAGLFVRLFMGYKCRKQAGPDIPSLIISNHNTNLDPALVELGFTRHMYFLASEHAFRNGLPSRLLKFVFGPIPINKTRPDISSIKEIIRRIKAGASVCLFAEGDRSFNGITSPIALSTAKLAKASGADLITFRLVGGYFTSPRWSKKVRRGRMSGGIVNKYSAAQLKAMTDKEVLKAIERDIYENAYAMQENDPVRYRGPDLAENIETALYLCPVCCGIGTIRSEGDSFFCGCGLRATYTEEGFLSGEALPFSTITEWDIWQTEQLEYIVKRAGDKTICCDENQQLYEVHAAAGKRLIGKGMMRIDSKAFYCAGVVFPLEQIVRFAIAGKMTLLFALKNGPTYEVRSAAARSALKYREIFRVLSAK